MEKEMALANLMYKFHLPRRMVATDFSHWAGCVSIAHGKTTSNHNPSSWVETMCHTGFDSYYFRMMLTKRNKIKQNDNSRSSKSPAMIWFTSSFINKMVPPGRSPSRCWRPNAVPVESVNILTCFSRSFLKKKNRSWILGLCFVIFLLKPYQNWCSLPVFWFWFLVLIFKL